MSSQLNKSLIRLLECPVCMNYMTKHIISCVRGHSICLSCGRQLNACPSCKRPISITHRNYTLESICELLEYPCVYAENGCQEYINLEESNYHRKTCSYRPYQCLLGGPFAPCDWKGTRFELKAHAQRNHDDKISHVNNNKYKWNSTSPPHEVYLIAIYDELFLLHRKIVQDKVGKFMMHFAVQYVGKSEDNIQFYYTLHISCEEYEHRNILFTEYCCDDLGTIDDIISQDFCLAVPFQLFETYQDKNQEVYFEVTIHKS